MVKKGLKKEFADVQHYVEVLYRHHGRVERKVEKRESEYIPWMKIFQENGIKFGDNVECYRYFDVVTSKKLNGEIVQKKENFGKVFTLQDAATEFAHQLFGPIQPVRET